MGKYEEFVDAYKKQDELGLKTNKELYTYLDLKPATYNNYKTKYLKTVGDYDSDEYLANKEREVDESLVKQAKQSPTALSTYYKRTGKLIEKKEEMVKVEYTHGEIARDADSLIGYFREQLDAEGGICPVCGKPNSVLAEICNNQVH